MKSIPQMLGSMTHRENRVAVALSVPVGLFFPLAGYLVMHPWGPVGGHGALSESGWVAWACRVVALACLTVSFPKVWDWLSVMFGGRSGVPRWCAFGGAVAVEATVLLIPDPWLSGFALALSTVINVCSVATSTTADHKEALRRAKASPAPRGDTLGLSATFVPPPPRKAPQKPARAVTRAPRAPRRAPRAA